MMIGSSNTDLTGHYSSIPLVLTTGIETVNTEIDIIVSYLKFDDQEDLCRNLHRLKELYNEQQACPHKPKRFPIPTSHEHVALLLELIDAVDEFNAFVKKIGDNDLGRLVETRDSKFYRRVQHALREFYKKECEILFRECV